jgi:hypothetical protein
MQTIFGLEYQPFWIIVTILVCAFFGSLLWWIGYELHLMRKNDEADKMRFVELFSEPAEDQVEDALDEKLK